jgi:hypothetical protein
MQLISKLKYFLLILTVSSIFSCNPKIDINAPYKEIPVVFGLLNQNDTLHYVKITKAFLGEESAFEMAKARENSEYGDILHVRIVESNHPQGLNRTFECERMLVTTKDTGIFYSPNQYVYGFRTPGAPLHQNARYTLLITNKETGQEIKSQTELIHRFDIISPGALPQNTISFSNIHGIANLTMNWNSSRNARRYTIRMILNYKEVNINTNDTLNKQLQWTFHRKSNHTRENEPIQHIIPGSEFFRVIGEQIPPAGPDVIRLVHTLDFYFDVVSDVINTYMEVNEPVSGILLDKPVYTNIENGIGIFGARFSQVRLDKYVNHQTALALKNHELTKDKKFVKFFLYTQGNEYYCCINDNANVCTGCD